MWWYGMAGSQVFPYGGWWALHMIAVVLFWAGFVVLGFIAVARARRKTTEYRSQDAGILSAVTILQERYARGEIGREEFLEKQRDLNVSL